MMWIINTILALCCILSAYGGVFSPEYLKAIPAIALLTFPIWMIAMPCLLLLDLIISKRSAAIPIVTMVLCIGPFLEFCPLTIFQKADKDCSTFSLLTYNTFNMANYNETSMPCSLTAGAILDADCDIECLQEMVTNFNSSHFVAKSQADSLNKFYKYQINSSNGLPIYSRYPVKRVMSVCLDDTSAKMDKYIVALDSTDVTIYNVHLQSIGLSNDDKLTYLELTRGQGDIKKIKADLLAKLNHAFKSRANQAKKIREYLDQDSAQNIIVCGDFNDVPTCYAIRMIMGNDFRNAYTEAGRGPSITYRANRFYFHIDQVLYKGDIIPVMAKTLEVGNSDHYPVKVIFEISKQ
ncbi:MAG: endonuclease/exonuclease/phosphatase family protein [Muribaculaceae bacterium]|nr:endonuclease/exonuclease/phosphatase family protein [Muribaculaceae bacterium]